MVVTGGYNVEGHSSAKRVSKYNIEGWVMDLPNLSVSRWSHGCGYYQDSNDNIVWFIQFISNLLFPICAGDFFHFGIFVKNTEFCIKDF